MRTLCLSLVLLAMSASLTLRADTSGTGSSSSTPGSPELNLIRDQLQALRLQRPSEGPPLTVNAVLDEALAHNPMLIVLRKEFEVARHRPAQRLALGPPTFEAQIWQWPFNTLNAGDTNMYMFTVGQALPGFGKRALRAAVADKDAELSLAAIAVEARGVIDQVKRVYAKLFLTRREIEIHHANLELLRQFADVSEAKYTTGGISQQDILKAVVELSRLHGDLVTLDERERLATARLNTLLDRPPESPVGRLVEPREDGPLPALAELQRIAVDRQPELRAARVEIERAEAVLAAERQEGKPDFFVKGGYFLMPRQADSWTAMVGITWPTAPWSRTGITAKVAEAGAAVEAARARQTATESVIRLAVHESYVRVEAAAERATLFRTSIVPQSDQTLAVSRAAYQTDQGDFLMLIDNQRILLDAQVEYYRALSDLEQARADLERAVGLDLPAAATTGAAPGRPGVTER